MIVRIAIIRSAIPLFDRWPYHSSVPTTFSAAAARSDGPGRSSGRREAALPWTGASTVARSRFFGSIAVVMISLVASVSASSCRVDAERVKTVRQPTRMASAHPFPEFTAEASHRFGIPESWIRAVMRVESAGEVRAVSKTGAIGLMQIMPGTWMELRSRYALGADPFDPHDNILAGAAYLREMHDRYGTPGFLAAYNAGPARYDDHLTTGRSLPAETRAYVAMLAPLMDATPVDSIVSVMKHVISWRQTPLFVVQAASRSNGTRPAITFQVDRSSKSPLFVSKLAFKSHAVGLFFSRSTRKQSR